jgi:hypothetical protein
MLMAIEGLRSLTVSLPMCSRVPIRSGWIPVMKRRLSYTRPVGPQVQAPTPAARLPLQVGHSHSLIGQHIGHAQPNPWVGHLRAGRAVRAVAHRVTGRCGRLRVTVDLSVVRMHVQCRVRQSSAKNLIIRVTALWPSQKHL